MKKAVNILSLLSVISLLTMVILYIYTKNSDLYTRFIVDWFLIPFALLSIPLFGHSLCLAVNRNRISAKIWLRIYAVIFILLIFPLRFDYLDQTRDLSYAIHGKYLAVTGEVEKVQRIGRDSKYQRCIINKIEFEFESADFSYIQEGKQYEFRYLPNSKYVVAIIDESGKTLLKTK